MLMSVAPGQPCDLPDCHCWRPLFPDLCMGTCCEGERPSMSVGPQSAPIGLGTEELKMPQRGEEGSMTRPGKDCAVPLWGHGPGRRFALVNIEQGDKINVIALQ